MKKKKGFLGLIFIFVAIVAFISLMASIGKGNHEMFFGDGYELMNENVGQSSTSSISIEISDTSFVGEQTILNVSSGSSVVVRNCSFSGSQESIIIVQGGELLLDSSTINAQTNLHPIDLKSGKLLLTGNTNITGSSTSNSSSGIIVRGNGDNDVLDTTDWTGSISMFSVGIDISAGGGESININLSSGTIKNCGTGIRSVNSSATLNISGDGIIRNNEQGVNFDGGEIEMSGGEIYSNYSSGDGGAIRATNLSKLTLSGGTIRNNSSTYSGGGIYLDSAKNVTISGTFKCSENTSVESGGGIYAQYTSITMSGGEISNNTLTGSGFHGGGIYFDGSSSSKFSMGKDATISGNKANGTRSDGGGIALARSATATISGTVSGNYAYRNGGGIVVLNKSYCTLSGAQILANNLRESDFTFGGGVYVAGGTLHFGYSSNRNTLIKYNNAGCGGGIQVHTEGNLTSTSTSNVSIENNEASSSGGGIRIHSSNATTLYGNISFIGNSAKYGGGLAIWMQTNVDEESGSVSLNKGISFDSNFSQSGSGGAIYAERVKINIANVNIKNCYASVGYGGAICLYDSVTCTIASGEVIGNYARIGGGAFFVEKGSTMTIGLEGYSESSVDICENYLSSTGSSGSYGGAMVAFDGSTITINNASISNNYIENTGSSKDIVYGGALEVEGNSTINFNGGSISGNYNSTTSKLDLYGGAVYVCDGGVFNQSGGTICYHSTARYGGAIYVTGSTAKVNITGGNIGSNSAIEHGGGLFVSKNAQFSMTDGQISYNYSNEGGGIYFSETDRDSQSENLISGGSVSSNYAFIDGGGIYLQDSQLDIRGGSVANNYTAKKDGVTDNNDGRGGGIFCRRAYLYVSGGAIESNCLWRESSRPWGGGIYLAESDMLLSSGGTIRNNIASPEKSNSSGGNILVDQDSYFEMQGGYILGDGETLQAQLGGGIASVGRVSIYRGYIQGNVATNGGGIASYGGFSLDLSSLLGSSYKFDYTKNILCINGSVNITGNKADIGSSILTGNEIQFDSAGDPTIDGTVALGATEGNIFFEGMYPHVQIVGEGDFTPSDSINIEFFQASVSVNLINPGASSYTISKETTLMENAFMNSSNSLVDGTGYVENVNAFRYAGDGLIGIDNYGDYFLFSDVSYLLTCEFFNNGRSKTVTVRGGDYRANIENFEIPGTVISGDGYTYITTKIGGFSKWSIKNLEIPATVEEFEAEAFKSVENLESVTINDNTADGYHLKTIGARAFFGCANLKNFTFENMIYNGTDNPMVFGSCVFWGTAIQHLYFQVVDFENSASDAFSNNNTNKDGTTGIYLIVKNTSYEDVTLVDYVRINGAYCLGYCYNVSYYISWVSSQIGKIF